MNNNGSFGLRESIQAIISSWYWVAGATVLAIIAAWAMTAHRPDVFSASSHVFVPVRSATFQPISGVRADYTVPETTSFVDLAMSDGVLEAALADSHLGESEGGVWSLSTLRSASRASAIESLLTLTVTARDPSQAATLANAWGEALTKKINDLYTPYGPEGSDLESLTAAALEKLQQAEAAIVDYHTHSSSELVGDRRAALGQLLSSFTIAEQSLAVVERDALSLDQELAAKPQADPPSYRDRYQAAMLFTRSAASSALLAGSNTASAGFFSSQPGIESLISASQQENPTVADLRSYLAQVVAQSRAAGQGLEESITSISAAIQSADGEEARYSADLRNLELVRDTARSNYVALTTRAQQESPGLQVLGGVAQLASQASVPGTPDGPHMIQTLLVAGAIGFILACAWVISLGWWRGGNPASASSDRAQ
jgi:uncharacterized protein involved in exopolysaccharide biosynthesis